MRPACWLREGAALRTACASRRPHHKRVRFRYCRIATWALAPRCRCRRPHPKRRTAAAGQAAPGAPRHLHPGQICHRTRPRPTPEGRWRVRRMSPAPAAPAAGRRRRRWRQRWAAGQARRRCRRGRRRASRRACRLRETPALPAPGRVPARDRHGRMHEKRAATGDTINEPAGGDSNSQLKVQIMCSKFSGRNRDTSTVSSLGRQTL